MTRVSSFCIAVLLTAIALPSIAHDYREGEVEIAHPWSRPTPPGIMMGVGYMTIHNTGDSDIVLKSLETPRAARVSIHESMRKDGIMRMRPLEDGLTIPAGGSVELKPLSYHLMLEKLKKPLKVGERIPLTLKFNNAQVMEVELSVDSMEAGQEEQGASGDHGTMDPENMDHEGMDHGSKGHQGMKHDH
ncbi:MAG: copper chaperone PCu(A)C [Marinobacter sp.]|uniref:copper chaperone PCu(A)C n=1 Tax=Marinobacter sp. TaxID=50741 RepID=UPI0034A09299